MINCLLIENVMIKSPLVQYILSLPDMTQLKVWRCWILSGCQEPMPYRGKAGQEESPRGSVSTYSPVIGSNTTYRHSPSQVGTLIAFIKNCKKHESHYRHSENDIWPQDYKSTKKRLKLTLKLSIITAILSTSFQQTGMI